MENNKIKYEEIENFDIIKEVLLNKVEKVKGKIPEGYDNDIFLSAFARVYNYLTTKYKNEIIPKNEIPDVNRFEDRENYTVGQFLFNRIINNIEKVEMSNDSSKNDSVGGYYHAGDKKLKIFGVSMQKNIDFAFEKYKNLNFESQQDFNKIVSEHFIIHELIHAISFDDFSIGFRVEDESVSINEGFTESLALEISGLNKFYEYIPEQIDDNQYGMIPRNTISSYVEQTNIADLVRIVAKKDLTLPYLVNPSKVKWLHIDGFDKSCYPLKEKQQVYDYIQKELHEITSNIGKITPNEHLNKLQKLQGCLISDITKNKYNKKFINDAINRNVTYEQLVQYDKDISTIINELVLTFSENTAKDIFTKGVQSLEIWDIENLKTKIENGKIEDTENVKKIIELLELKQDLLTAIQQNQSVSV